MQAGTRLYKKAPAPGDGLAARVDSGRFGGTEQALPLHQLWFLEDMTMDTPRRLAQEAIDVIILTLGFRSGGLGTVRAIRSEPARGASPVR